MKASGWLYFQQGKQYFRGVSLSSQMTRTAPTECFFSEVEMATTEFAGIGIYRVRWSGVEWEGVDVIEEF